ncbi:MAG: argininosuccinate lyase [Treponema sp.]|nr:argininosuccinate lyase [Treponema sp.]
MNKKKNALDGGNHAALWHGRFTEGPDAEAIAFETSIYVDSRMAFDDIAGSIAHAKMLGEMKIISRDEAEQIVNELENIRHDLKNGSLQINESAEDIHSFIEGVLTDRIGEAGKKLHTGRSRNDQIALDERLWLRRAIPDLQKRIHTLIKTLTEIAENHTESLLSGYTHLQRAQPVTLAHHLCAWCWMLVRDYERFSDALKRIDLSPLGSGALAGSTLPLNREMVASFLSFSGVTQNSLDSVSDRDYFLEMSSALAILQTHLSRFCEEIVLWSTEEFKFIDLSEKWSTGSSIMPQKKNPDFAELIRGRTGKVYGNMVALFTMIKALPLSYNRDLQEDKSSFFDAYDTVYSCLGIFIHMIGSTKWNVDKMAASCFGGYANATDLADYVVRKGMPFRTAHGVAARLVRKAIEKKCNLEDLSLEEMKSESDLIEEDIFDMISPRACMEGRKTTGGPSPNCVKEQIKQLKNFVKK